MPENESNDPPRPTPTVELLQAARSGDRTAVEALFVRLLPRVRGLAALRMGNGLVDLADRDDVVQESLLAALTNVGAFAPRHEGSLVCWLTRIVHSRVEHALRAGRAGKRGGGAVVRRADLGSSTLAELPVAAPGRSPSEEVGARQLDERLERALLGLAAKERQTVYCRLVLDMEFADVAAELGLANGDSARALFHKALVKLRERLGDGGALLADGPG